MKKIHNTKASEIYVEQTFEYGNIKKNWYIPIKQPKGTGIDLEDSSNSKIKKYLKDVKVECDPKNWGDWRSTQEEYWDKYENAGITKGIFDLLMEDFSWVPVKKFNSRNYARRIQEIIERGYTVARGVKRVNKKTNTSEIHVLLIPLPRGGVRKYEQWSPETRERILSVLNNYDVYENRFNKNSLLPDHKFPEVRWDDNTARASEEIAKLTDDEIKKDFQLITNQRNLQKREACRRCYQSGERGIIFGVNYFYSGNEKWDDKYPKTGKDAENGCYGCGWYDIEKWRISINKKLKKRINT